MYKDRAKDATKELLLVESVLWSDGPMDLASYLGSGILHIGYFILSANHTANGAG